MFVAGSTRCFSDLSFEDALAQLKDLHYDRIELWAHPEGHLTPGRLLDDAEKFVAEYRETTRLTPVAVHFDCEVEAEMFETICAFAKLIRLAQVTIPASPLGTPFNMEIDRLRALQAIGTREGVRLSLKTEADSLTSDPQTAIEICNAVKGLGITLDPSNYLCSPQGPVKMVTPDGYDVTFPFVYHTHLRDTSNDEYQVPFGRGEIDYTRIVAALRKHRYDRALCVDMDPSMVDPEQRPLEMRKLRMFLESLL